jgi:hypothetical protein
MHTSNESVLYDLNLCLCHWLIVAEIAGGFTKLKVRRKAILPIIVFYV